MDTLSGAAERRTAFFRPVWPAVIGTLSIVFAVQKGVMIFVPTLNVRVNVTTITLVGGGPWFSWLVAWMATEVALAVLLLLAGVGLVRRSRHGLAHLQYAFLRGIWTFVAAGFLVWYFFGPEGWFDKEAPFEGPARQAALAIVIMVLWELIYPVFLVVWFSRRAIRRQTCACSLLGDIRPVVAGDGPRLVEALKDGDRRTRVSAARAIRIGEVATPEIETSLAEARKDREEAVRCEAARALKRIQEGEPETSADPRNESA